MPKTILCADDSATMQAVAAITFKTSDFAYVGARSCDDAVRVAREAQPALILADAIMPGKNGYDLCQAIKSDPDLAKIPVVLMCGNSAAYDAAKGKQVGADGHVTKPWDSQQLIDKITELLSKAASDGVARPGDGAAVAGKPSAAAPAAAAVRAAATPAPAASPRTKTPVPSVPPRAPAVAAKPVPAVPAVTAPAKPIEPPRSMTLMGMPTLKMPPGGKPGPAPDFTPIPSTSSSAEVPAVDHPRSDDSMERPPMIKAVPTKRLSFAAYARHARRASPEELAEARAEAARVAKDAGHNLSDGQAAALLELSRDVVERIVWEAVPDLAETIIRENLDRLVSKR
jgi:CheY-like chemotaxis protein